MNILLAKGLHFYNLYTILFLDPGPLAFFCIICSGIGASKNFDDHFLFLLIQKDTGLVA